MAFRRGFSQRGGKNANNGPRARYSTRPRTDFRRDRFCEPLAAAAAARERGPGARRKYTKRVFVCLMPRRRWRRRRCILLHMGRLMRVTRADSAVRVRALTLSRRAVHRPPGALRRARRPRRTDDFTARAPRILLLLLLLLSSEPNGPAAAVAVNAHVLQNVAPMSPSPTRVGSRGDKRTDKTSAPRSPTRHYLPDVPVRGVFITI